MYIPLQLALEVKSCRYLKKKKKTIVYVLEKYSFSIYYILVLHSNFFQLDKLQDDDEENSREMQNETMSDPRTEPRNSFV